jgi:hypothetical protein
MRLRLVLIKWLAIPALAAMLAGCTPPSWWHSAGVPAAPPSQPAVSTVLQDTATVLAASGKQRAAAWREAEQAFAKSPSAPARLKLALLAALLPPPQYDARRAAKLLRDFEWQNAPSGYASVASIVLQFISTERAAEASTARAKRSLADERRRSAHLQSQLDALRAIEKALNSRVPPPAVSPPAD